ncbi:MAG: hypothetical protein PHP42_04375 [Bacteroidota bacterium]|nr:hypothetical protein [Bacteroidota bacterium]
MFTEIRRNIGIDITRMLFRKKKVQTMSFSHIFSNAKTALVIVPENPDHRSVVMPILTLLQNKFQGTKLTLVAHETFRNLASAFLKSTVFVIREEHLNFFFLPKKSEIRSLLSQKFDVVVDLNVTPVPAAAYLCRGINAPLKVGFTKDHADAFYNFQFNITSKKNAKSCYDQLFRTLSMF